MISYTRHQIHLIEAAREFFANRRKNKTAEVKLDKQATKFLGIGGGENGANKDPKKIINDPKTIKRIVGFGKVFSFRYNAKHKATLPYYDRYPLILVIKNDRRRKMFTGLNLHYIQPELRILLLRNIRHLYMEGPDRYFVKDFFGDINRWAKMLAKPCVHTYRLDKVMNVQLWNIPTLLMGWMAKVKDETFIRSGVSKVWFDSRKQMFRGARWKERQKAREKAAKMQAAHSKFKAQRRKNALKAREQRIRKREDQRKKFGAVKPRSGMSKTSRRSKARTGKRYSR